MSKTILLLSLLTISSLPGCIIVLDHDDSDCVSGIIGGDVEKGSGHAVRESRTVEPFHRIVARDAIDVDVRVGEPQSVTVRSDDNFVSWVETSVSNGELTVRWASHPIKKGSVTMVAPRVEIVVPALDRIQLDGMGDVHVVGLSSDTLAMQVGGAGGVRVEGKVGRLDLYSSGIGDAELFGLEVRDADVTVSGSGDVELDVRDRLRASITGTGDVRYHGHPKDVSKSIAGTGNVEED
jgi:hypothetical protein